MDKSKWGVHEEHCCILHGCKYGDPDCPVVNRQTKQHYLCEACDDDGINTVEEATLKADGFTMLNLNKMYASIDGVKVCINGYKFSGDMITLYLLHGEEKNVYAGNVMLMSKD